MLNFGWAELLVIGVVALIVIGPDDLPDMFRQLGRFTAKLRQMSREFSRAMEQAAKESGVKDVARDLKASTSAKALGLEAVKAAADKFEKWDPIKNAAKPTLPMAAGAKPLVPPPLPEMPKPGTPKPGTPKPDLGVNDADAAAEDLADHEEPTIGPATRALYDKQALRARVLAEQSEKLRAIEAGTYQGEVAGKPPRARRAKAVAKSEAPKPATARTPRKADQKAQDA